MESNKPVENKMKMFSRPWMVWVEILAIIGFIVCAFIFTYRGSSERRPSDLSQVDAILTEADTYYKKQDLAKAVYLYWQALQILETEQSDENKAQRLHTNIRIAEIYTRKNWQKDAKARLEYAANIQPDHDDVRLLSGKLYRDEGSIDKATEEFLAIYDKNPDHAEANYLLAVLYQGRKQYKSAEMHYRLAIDNDPEYIYIPSEKAPIGVLARLQLSRTYNKMFQGYQFLDRELTNDDYDEISRLESQSILLLEEALLVRPDMQEIINDLVRLLYVRAQALSREAATRPYADALEVYERIVDLDPTETQAWQGMAEIYESYLIDKPKALEMYRKVYELEPHATYLAIIKSLEEEISVKMKR